MDRRGHAELSTIHHSGEKHIVLLAVLCTVDDSNYFFNFEKYIKYCKPIEMFLERISVKSGPSAAAASADQQQNNSGANRKVTFVVAADTKDLHSRGFRYVTVNKSKEKTQFMFTTSKGYAHISCGQSRYLIMNESTFDQLCCPVSQCLLYRFITECEVKGRF